MQATKNKEVYEYYTAGVKRDQSKIVFEEAKLMLNGSPLRKKFKLTNNAITHVKTGSYIKALSKEDGKTGDGTNPAGLIVDEYHQHKTTEFLDLGLGSNTKESFVDDHHNSWNGSDVSLLYTGIRLLQQGVRF